jgi:hypothetical protein
VPCTRPVFLESVCGLSQCAKTRMVCMYPPRIHIPASMFDVSPLACKIHIHVHAHKRHMRLVCTCSKSSLDHTLPSSHFLPLSYNTSQPAIAGNRPARRPQLVICSGDWPLTQEPQRGAVKLRVSRAHSPLLIRCSPDAETARANPEGASVPARQRPGRLLGYACRVPIRANRQSTEITASSCHRSNIAAP